MRVQAVSPAMVMVPARVWGEGNHGGVIESSTKKQLHKLVSKVVKPQLKQTRGMFNSVEQLSMNVLRVEGLLHKRWDAIEGGEKTDLRVVSTEGDEDEEEE